MAMETDTDFVDTVMASQAVKLNADKEDAANGDDSRDVARSTSVEASASRKRMLSGDDEGGEMESASIAP